MSGSWRSRASTALLGAWGAITGVAPHVLHHVGPLAGAAFLAGAAGRSLFAAIALVTSVPFLLRLRRRFESWAAPAVALVVMAALFLLSTFVVGPAISGDDPSSRAPVQRTEHEEHGH